MKTHEELKENLRKAVAEYREYCINEALNASYDDTMIDEILNHIQNEAAKHSDDDVLDMVIDCIGDSFGS